MRQNITDRSGRVIGATVDQGNRIILLDGDGYNIGSYNKTQDITLDGNSRFYCRGNRLTSLL